MNASRGSGERFPQRLFVAGVHDVAVRVVHFRERRQVMDAFSLDPRWATPVMPLGAGLAFSQQFPLQLEHEIGVFAMGGDDHAEFLGETHGVIQLFVADAERALVREENLEAADAFLHDLGKLVFAFLVQARHGLVEREIAGTMAFGFAEPKLEAVGERLLHAGLADHLDDRRRTADERSLAGRFMRILRESSHERQIDVHMGIDEAGEHILARSIDDGGLGRRVEIRPDAGDLLTLAIDVRRVLFAGGDDTTILDEK